MAAAGILLVDKPGGMTSHDVVARARRALGTRKIGHAGTLDPMATGLLILGVEGATRLLTFIVGLDKTYEATIRLGVATDTDDAEGVETARADAAALAAVTPERIAAGVAALTGRISQVPSTVSAIKVAGRRAYDLAREGVEVELKAREVTVSRFEVLDDAARARRHRPRCRRRLLERHVHPRARARPRRGARRRRPPHGAAPDADRSVRRRGRGIRRRSGRCRARRPRRRRDRGARPPRRDRRRGARPAPRQAPRRRRAATRRRARQPRSTPTAALVGIVERRGDDVKSVMNMPEEARPMILWFTYVEVVVAVAAGLLCIVAGLAGRRPSDFTVGSLALRGAAAPRADRDRDHRAVRRQPADRQPPGVLGLPRVGGAAADRRGVAWALLERSRWSTVIMGIAALAVAVMVWRMQVDLDDPGRLSRAAPRRPA